MKNAVLFKGITLVKKISCIFLLLACLQVDAQSFKPKNTFVLITGVLKWQDSKNLSPFSNVHRKDEELKSQLIKLGVPPSNILMLLDEKATLKAIQAQAKNLSARCNDSSTFIFYYAGHGIKQDDGFYFANYDIKVNNCTQTGLNLSWLSNRLLQVNKSKNFMFWADCCYSGGLLEQAKIISEKGRNALVFSSATASNTSTGNWTFTQTLIDCLSGNTLYDADHDGKLTDTDISHELRDAMKYREHQKHGFFSSMKGFVFIDNLPKTAATKLKPGDESLVIGQYAYGLYENNWKPVRIIGKNEYTYTPRFYFYSDYKDVELGKRQVKEIHLPTHNVDAVVNVTWEGKQYEASILKTDNDFYYVKYKGYEDSWNEWVMYDRIHTGNEKKAQIEYEGKWYPGEVLEEEKGKYFIRYNSYDFSWDEWVGAKRIKLD